VKRRRLIASASLGLGVLRLLSACRACSAMGCLPEDLKLLIREASVIEIVPDNARRPAFSFTEYVCLYHSGDDPHRTERNTHWPGRQRKTAAKFKDLQKRTKDRWQSSKSIGTTNPPSLHQIGHLGRMLDDVDTSSALTFHKALGSVCPKSPRLPMRRTSDDSKEAANGREEKPLKPPVRRTSMEIDLPTADRPGRRGTSTCVGSSCSETRASLRDGDLSSVIGKLLHELEDLELVSSDEEYSCEDDDFDENDEDSFHEGSGLRAPLLTARPW
jgi:hypothetical protein